jgi:hypothetical protein
MLRLSVIVLSFIMLSVVMLSVIVLSVIVPIIVMLSAIVLSVVMPSIVMLSVIVISAVMLSVGMLIVIMLNVIVLSVIVPSVIVSSVVMLRTVPSYKKLIEMLSLPEWVEPPLRSRASLLVLLHWPQRSSDPKIIWGAFVRMVHSSSGGCFTSSERHKTFFLVADEEAK